MRWGEIGRGETERGEPRGAGASGARRGRGGLLAGGSAATNVSYHKQVSTHRGCLPWHSS